MARIRSLKPEMWSSESVGRLSRDARLLLVSLITQVDDDGRIRASSRGLASLLYPFDEDAPRLIDDWLAQLQAEGMFIRYMAEGSTYGYLTKFRLHQKIDHPSNSKLPAFTEALANPRESSRILAPDQDQGSGLDQDQGSGLDGDTGKVAKAPKQKSEAELILADNPYKISGPKRGQIKAVNELLKTMDKTAVWNFLRSFDEPLWPDRLIAAAARCIEQPRKKLVMTPALAAIYDEALNSP